MSIYVRAVDKSGAEWMPAQPMEALPREGDVIGWRTDLRVSSSAVRWERRELMKGNVKWLACVTVEPMPGAEGV